MTDSPTITDEPVLDLADVDAADTDVELPEPTATELPEVPVVAPVSDDPHALAGRITETVYQLADAAAKLPGLIAQRDEIAEKLHAVQREYTAAVSEASRTFGSKTEPLSHELTDTEAAIEAAVKAKAQLESLAAPPK